MSEVVPEAQGGPQGAGTERYVELVDRLTAIRGVDAAAIVRADGEYLHGTARDERLLERMVSTVTNALAAGEALADLLEAPSAGHAAEASAEVDDEPGDEPGADVEPGSEAAESSARQLMVMYQDGGPILFTPLAEHSTLAVVALGSAHDIGRVRFQLRSLTSSAT